MLRYSMSRSAACTVVEAGAAARGLLTREKDSSEDGEAAAAAAAPTAFLALQALKFSRTRRAMMALRAAERASFCAAAIMFERRDAL